MTGSRDWFYSVGPLDAEGAREVSGDLDAAVSNDLDLSLVDHAQWFVGAWDAETVIAVADILDRGVADLATPADTRDVASGILSAMRLWLERDYRAGAP